MSKRFGLLLAVLVAVSLLLVACGSETQDTAKEYIEAVLKGNTEEAQKVACESFQDATAELAAMSASLADENKAIRNLNLKYDIGKANNVKEIIVTGSYDIVELNEAGKMVADSEKTFELAASTRDKYDVDGDGDDTDTINTRIVLDMEKDGGKWCVAGLEGGYFSPESE